MMDTKKLKQDDLVSFVTWAKVSHNAHGVHLVVEDLDSGDVLNIKGTELIERLSLCDHWEKEEKVSRTELAKILIESWNIPLKVCFIKKDGSERELRGRLVSHEHLMGRSSVEDLDVKSGHRLRQVDHRTINWLIVNGVKYVAK